MNNLETLFSQIIGAVKMFNFFDLLDIILISYLIYKAIKLVRETRAEQLVKGIILLSISYF
ncbi:MAG: TIGR00159 family protein, partial [Oscillospiraceae bacterium]